MLMKFGKLVDLEALQTLSGNRNLEEMRQDSRVREAAYTQEVRQWEVWQCVCVSKVFVYDTHTQTKVLCL